MTDSVESAESYSIDGNKKAILLMTASSKKNNSIKRGRAKIVLGVSKSRESSLGDSNGGEVESFFTNMNTRVKDKILEMSDQKSQEQEDPVFDNVRHLIPQFNEKPMHSHPSVGKGTLDND